MWWIKQSSLSTLPLLLTQMHNNGDAHIYDVIQERKRDLTHNLGKCFLVRWRDEDDGFSRINLPIFPRDSSSFWIWFSRKNMATANASSARSCNLGGIMTLSSPIKSSREGFGQSMLRGGHTENAHTATTVITKRLSVCAWPSLRLRVWISPDVQIL